MITIMIINTNLTTKLVFTNFRRKSYNHFELSDIRLLGLGGWVLVEREMGSDADNLIVIVTLILKRHVEFLFVLKS